MWYDFKFTATIEDRAVIERILTHMGLVAQPPRASARRGDLLQAAWCVNPARFFTGAARVTACALAKMRCKRAKHLPNSPSRVEILQKTAGIEEIFARYTARQAADSLPIG